MKCCEAYWPGCSPIVNRRKKDTAEGKPADANAKKGRQEGGQEAVQEGKARPRAFCFHIFAGAAPPSEVDAACRSSVVLCSAGACSPARTSSHQNLS